MAFRAIKIDPANAPVIFEELDLVITNYETIGKDYIVAGYGPPMDYVFYTKDEFDREWRFILGQENVGKFSLVMGR
jgi:hypothetical protein